MVERARILLVDDNPNKLLTLQAVLEELDVEIVTAGSARQALKLLLHQDFAVILLDVIMPEMNGFEAAELIRQRPRSEFTPIIFVTSISTSETERSRGYLLGAVDYLFTPLVPEILRAKVSVFVELYRKNHEVQLLNRQLQRVNEELQETNQELETFSYSVSHDLHTPLRTVSNLIQLMFDDFGGSMDEQLQDYLQCIRGTVDRLDGLVESLLNLSRVARAPLIREPVDLVQSARRILSELQTATRVTMPQELPARADPNLVNVILQNLLHNAIKFSGKAARPQVELGSKRLNAETVYYVKDNGVGFDARYQDDLFSPFRRLHSADEFPGSGIGLATVQRAVRRHGGRIWAESQLGHGATFFFTLPPEETEQDSVIAPAVAREESPTRLRS